MVYRVLLVLFISITAAQSPLALGNPLTRRQKIEAIDLSKLVTKQEIEKTERYFARLNLKLEYLVGHQKVRLHERLLESEAWPITSLMDLFLQSDLAPSAIEETLNEIVIAYNKQNNGHYDIYDAIIELLRVHVYKGLQHSNEVVSSIINLLEFRADSQADEVLENIYFVTKALRKDNTDFMQISTLALARLKLFRERHPDVAPRHPKWRWLYKSCAALLWDGKIK